MNTPETALPGEGNPRLTKQAGEWDSSILRLTLCMSYRRRVAPNAPKTPTAVSSMQLFSTLTPDFR